MKSFAALLLIAALASGSASAQESAKNSLPPAAKPGDLMTGSGLVCDTQQQAARFVSLMSDNVEKALVAVNNEAGQSDACIVATVGFFPGSKVAEVVKDGTVINVIQILVMAVATPGGLRVIEPKVYYSVVETKERSI